MNSKALPDTNARTEPIIKAISDTAERHEKSLLELMDSINGGTDIEFNPPIANIICKPTVLD